MRGTFAIAIVFHHLPGQDAKQSILRDIATRLKSGAPLILAGNHYAYASQPLVMAAWAERWRMNGASGDEIKSKLGKILQGADPPESEDAVAALLIAAGFEKPQRFFSSLFWGLDHSAHLNSPLRSSFYPMGSVCRRRSRTIHIEDVLAA